LGETARIRELQLPGVLRKRNGEDFASSARGHAREASGGKGETKYKKVRTTKFKKGVGHKLRK